MSSGALNYHLILAIFTKLITSYPYMIITHVPMRILRPVFLRQRYYVLGAKLILE